MRKLLLVLSILIGLSFFMGKEEKPVEGLNIGNIAPNLTGASPYGDTLSLINLRGNYVFLDFWASWCRPCRYENRNLVKTFNHFNNFAFPVKKTWMGRTKKVQGFKVFSVSLDGNKESWLRAIKNDQLTWPWHISDLKHWNSKLAARYNINSIPTNFLLDPKGKIIGKDLKGKQLDTLLESLRFKTDK